MGTEVHGVTGVIWKYYAADEHEAHGAVACGPS